PRERGARGHSHERCSTQLRWLASSWHGNDVLKVRASAAHGIVFQALAGPPLRCKIAWTFAADSLFSQRYRSMARTASLALFFLVLCLSRPALADEATRVPRATTQQVQATVERAIGYLQTESAAWLRTRKCAACHHAPMPLWALSEADRQGYAIDKKFLADTAVATLASLENMIASKLVSNPADPPDPRPSARGVNMGTVFMAVAAQSLPLDKGQKRSLPRIADDIVTQ